VRKKKEEKVAPPLLFYLQKGKENLARKEKEESFSFFPEKEGGKGKRGG